MITLLKSYKYFGKHFQSILCNSGKSLIILWSTFSTRHIYASTIVFFVYVASSSNHSAPYLHFLKRWTFIRKPPRSHDSFDAPFPTLRTSRGSPSSYTFPLTHNTHLYTPPIHTQPHPAFALHQPSRAQLCPASSVSPI